jgi:TPR repeat protein
MATEYNYEVALEAFQHKDYKKVLELALPHAIAGDSSAQCMISLLYQCGFGVERDFGKAEEWLIKAAQQNNAVAWNNLGSLYALRASGLSRGPEAATECYQRAKDLGFDCAWPYPPPAADE